MMKGLFNHRRQEHRHDEAVRRETADVLKDHRASLKRVRGTLRVADETLGEEIRRLDRVLEGHPT